MKTYDTKQSNEAPFTSKFRVVPIPSVIGVVNENQPKDLDPDMQSAQSLLAMKASTKRQADAHPVKSCSRCYRLKKKCLRDLPRCSLCTASHQECVYTERKVRKRKSSGDASSPVFLVSLESFRDIDQEKSSWVQPADPIPESDHGIIIGPQPADRLQDREEKNASPTQEHRKSHGSAQESTPAGREPANINVSNCDRPGLRRPSIDKSERLRRFASRADSTRSFKAQKTDSWYNTTMHRYADATNSYNAAEEFLATKSIADRELPSRFAAAYFNTYNKIHPLIDEQAIIDTVTKTDFSNGLIVSVEIYVVLAIGCRIYDYEKKTDHFAGSFSHKNVDSVLDMLDLGITERTPPDSAAYNMRLLLLVILYNMCVLDDTKCQRLLGVASLISIQLRYYCTSDSHAQQIFWLLYILDKHSSLVWSRPLFLPQDAFILIPLPVQCAPQAKGSFTQHQVVLARIRGRVLSRKLGDDACKAKELLSEINVWHTVAMTACDYDDKWKREQYIHWTNMQRFYVLVELDQIEPGICSLLKPTMGYLSSSFASVLGEGDGALSPSKSLVWRRELLNVVQYSLNSLLHVLLKASASNRLDVSLQLGEANCTLQVLTNLLEFLRARDSKISSEPDWVEEAGTQLQNLSVCILKNNAISCDASEFTAMSLLVEEIQASL